MSRPAVANFVDSFFSRTLFQPDDGLASSVLSAELALDAAININGNELTAEIFIGLITTQFRGAFSASVISIQDLNIVPANEAKTTGIVGQFSKYETKGKEDGKVLKQSATTIVKVDERDGKMLITAIWEAQTVDEE
uniref:Uncharacterized protein n=1 Tax=Kwoniella bestiolae CBS 10118 TaxID=1296100 RepID=A0A1B9G733_9TREE|nr:hypothetical protein I302_04525 [Kwoniella bestiolae CBS 10118]OCF26835.1 hypothetical protein I302_04525 [Kwoniella bestiolae CBS 10118]